jgi:hypothetical protein
MYGVLYTVIKRYFENFCLKHKDFLLNIPTTASHMLQSSCKTSLWKQSTTIDSLMQLEYHKTQERCETSQVLQKG